MTWITYDELICKLKTVTGFQLPGPTIIYFSLWREFIAD
jgi:hypothetical protein